MELPALPREFHQAVERKDWDTAALYALVAAAEFIESVGPEAAEALIEELEAEDKGPHRGSRAKPADRRRRRG